MKAAEFQETINKYIRDQGVLILDGALGTMLEHRGYPTSPPIWTADAHLLDPGLVAQLHLEYLHAGADIICSNTFRTTRYTYAKVNRDQDALRSSARAIEIARDCIDQSGKHAFLAGVIAPLEDCFEPGATPESDTLLSAHEEQARILMDLGADFILAETLGTLREATQISRVCGGAGYPFMLSFRSTGHGTLQDGTEIREAVTRLAPFEPQAILLNCNSPEHILADYQVLVTSFDGLSGAYANAPGKFVSITEWNYPIDPIKQFSASCANLARLGAKIIGGCCGTTPEMIGELAMMIDNQPDTA